MSLTPNQHLCTCDQRQHACSPPCRVHPERGGGLGDPGVLSDGLPGGFPTDSIYEAWLKRTEAEAQRRREEDAER